VGLILTMTLEEAYFAHHHVNNIDLWVRKEGKRKPAKEKLKLSPDESNHDTTEVSEACTASSQRPKSSSAIPAPF